MTAALPTDLRLHEQCRVVVAQLGRLTPATLRAATRGLLRLCHHTVAHHATGTRHFSARQRAARFERRHEARCAVSYGAATVAHAHNTTCDVATAHTATQSTRPSSLDLWGRCKNTAACPRHAPSLTATVSIAQQCNRICRRSVGRVALLFSMLVVVMLHVAIGCCLLHDDVARTCALGSANRMALPRWSCLRCAATAYPDRPCAAPPLASTAWLCSGEFFCLFDGLPGLRAWERLLARGRSPSGVEASHAGSDRRGGLVACRRRKPCLDADPATQRHCAAGAASYSKVHAGFCAAGLRLVYGV